MGPSWEKCRRLASLLQRARGSCRAPHRAGARGRAPVKHPQQRSYCRDEQGVTFYAGGAGRHHRIAWRRARAEHRALGAQRRRAGVQRAQAPGVSDGHAAVAVPPGEQHRHGYGRRRAATGPQPAISIDALGRRPAWPISQVCTRLRTQGGDAAVPLRHRGRHAYRSYLTAGLRTRWRDFLHQRLRGCNSSRLQRCGDVAAGVRGGIRCRRALAAGDCVLRPAG